MAAKKASAPNEHRQALVKDPEMRIGEHLRVFHRTDGVYVIHDDRAPIGQGAVRGPDGETLTWTKITGAKAHAERMVRNGLA